MPLDLDREFRKLRHSICCLNNQINENTGVSEDTVSKYLLTETSDNVFEFDGVKSKSINSSFSGIPYFKLPLSFLTSTINSVTKNGAMSTAVVTAVGPYEKIAVTAGTNTSYVKINDSFLSDANTVASLKVKLDTIGTNSLVGLRRINNAGVGDTNTNNISFYVNLNTGVIFRNSTAMTTAGTIAPFAANSDIIEFTWIRDYKTWHNEIQVKNLTTGANLYAQNLGSGDIDTYITIIANPALTLADGTFTVLDWEIKSTTPHHPKLVVVGDSQGSGYHIANSDTIFYRLDNALPYNIGSTAGPGAYIYSIQKSQLPEVVAMKPDAVLLFSYLSIYYGDFKVADPDYTTWKAAWDKVMNGIIAYGGRVILPKIDTWPLFGNSNEALWNTFVDGEVVAHPTTLVLDLRGETLTYDNSGYHYNGASYEIIKNKIITLLEGVSLL